LALTGAFIKIHSPQRLERVDLGLYLGLGWLILIAWEQFRAVVGAAGGVLIIAGGLLCTVGAGFHAWRTLRFQNAIWHGFVLTAAVCHYVAVLRELVEQRYGLCARSSSVYRCIGPLGCLMECYYSRAAVACLARLWSTRTSE
jgi:hypothetical protein